MPKLTLAEPIAVSEAVKKQINNSFHDTADMMEEALSATYKNQ